MKRLLILSTSALILGACAAPVAPLLCDREAIAWDKFGDPSEFWEVCEAPAAPFWGIFTPRETRDYDDEPRPSTPSTPDKPTDRPDKPSTPDKPTDKPDKPTDKPDKPTDRPKGNNGWGNGSQDAPGNSGPNNRAENGPKGKNDGRGKNSGNSGKDK